MPSTNLADVESPAGNKSMVTILSLCVKDTTLLSRSIDTFGHPAYVRYILDLTRVSEN
jgi:hypothetical protein